MSDIVRPWLEEGGPEGWSTFLESARLDEPTPAQLVALQGALGPLFWTPPGGGPPSGGGDSGGAPQGGSSGGGASAGGSSSAGASSGGAASAGGAAAGAGAAKLIVVAAVSTVVAGAVAFQGGRAWEQRAAGDTARTAMKQPAMPTAPTPTPAPAPLPATPTAPAPIPSPAHATPAPKPKPVPPAPVPAPPPAAPADEVGLLSSAMAEVRAGHPANALTQLEQHERAFPDSSVAQERDVLRIEALLQLGRRDEAERRAAAFKARWPTSTHLVRIEALLRR